MMGSEVGQLWRAERMSRTMAQWWRACSAEKRSQWAADRGPSTWWGIHAGAADDLVGDGLEPGERLAVPAQLHLEEPRLHGLVGGDHARRLGLAARRGVVLQHLGRARLDRALLLDQAPLAGHQRLHVAERQVGGQGDVVEVLLDAPAGHLRGPGAAGGLALLADGLEGVERLVQAGELSPDIDLCGRHGERLPSGRRTRRTGP